MRRIATICNSRRSRVSCVCFSSSRKNESHPACVYGTEGVLANLASSFFIEEWLDLPPLPEQTAIAAVLSDIDTELAALEQRREKARALKQGMMQELLTGRTRLVES